MKSSVFNLRLNTASDGNDGTIGGKLFQTRAAATGNVLSPIVKCFIYAGGLLFLGPVTLNVSQCVFLPVYNAIGPFFPVSGLLLACMIYNRITEHFFVINGSIMK